MWSRQRNGTKYQSYSKTEMKKHLKVIVGFIALGWVVYTMYKSLLWVSPFDTYESPAGTVYFCKLAQRDSLGVKIQGIQGIAEG